MIPKIEIQIFDDGVSLDITTPKGETKELKWWNEGGKVPIEKVTQRINAEVNSWYIQTFKLDK